MNIGFQEMMVPTFTPNMAIEALWWHASIKDSN